MATQVASLFGVLSLDDRQFRTGMQGARSEMTNLRSPMQSMVSNVQTAGKVVLGAMGAVSIGAGLAGKALLDMGNDASVLLGVEEAFQGLVESTGRGSREMLSELRKQSAGMADQQELMLTYNKAAQLVGTTFANELPNAMDELAKVASATGQDMGFLMDSLVTGVGRLSPMILDNLGIQVDLTAAYEDYATSIGKSADELSKAEQQTALMNQVMEKLESNTADMPSVLGQTDTKVAAFEASMRDLRFTIGRLVVPALDGLVTVGQGVVNILDLLITGDFKGGIFGFHEDSPLITFLLGLREGMQAIMAGVPIFDVLANLLGEVAQQAFAYGDLPLFDFLINLREFVVNTLKPIGDWISSNIKLEDVLIGLGIAVASVVIPAIIGLLVAAAPIVLTIAALIGAVALLRQAWESDFGGIRTFITEQALPAVINFIQNTVLPGIQDFFDWLGGVWATVQPKLEKLRVWFVEEALPAVLNFINDTIIPGIQDFFDFLGGLWAIVQPKLEELRVWFVEEALPAVLDFINTQVIPKIETFRDILGGIFAVVEPLLNQLKDWFITDGLPLIQGAIEDVTGIWEDFQTSLSELWTTVQPLIQPIVDWFRDTFQWIGKNFIQPVIDFISDIITKAGEALELLRQIGGGAPQSVDVGPAVGGFQPSFGRGFSTGGFTGYGPPNQAKGVVHAQEFVVPKDGALVMREGGGGITFNGPITVIADDPNSFIEQLKDRARKKGV